MQECPNTFTVNSTTADGGGGGGFNDGSSASPSTADSTALPGSTPLTASPPSRTLFFPDQNPENERTRTAFPSSSDGRIPDCCCGKSRSAPHSTWATPRRRAVIRP